MKLRLFILIASNFLFTNLVYCQNYISNYHPFINKAEMHLIQGNYESAIDEYNNAFKLQGFGKDYYNAAVASMKLKQPDSALKYLIQLSNKGLDLKNIVDASVFEPLILTSNWKKFQFQYLSNLVTFIKSQDKNLMNELNELDKLDQAYRGFENSYEDDGLMPIIRNIDSLNVKKLVKIIEKYGYPNENIWGLDSINHFHHFDVVIWHQAKNKYQFFSFEKILFNAIDAGKLNPEYGGFLIENNSGDGKFWTNLVFKIRLEGDLKTKYVKDSNIKWRLKNYYN